MTIDGTNISTYGMKLIRTEGLYDLPKRKKTTEFRTHDAADIVTEANKVAVTILGRGYADLAAVASAVTSLKTLIKSSTVHEIVLVGHDETFNGTFADGFKATPYLANKAVIIKAEITVVQ